jgi:hypothetical protein
VDTGKPQVSSKELLTLQYADNVHDDTGKCGSCDKVYFATQVDARIAVHQSRAPCAGRLNSRTASRAPLRKAFLCRTGCVRAMCKSTAAS